MELPPLNSNANSTKSDSASKLAALEEEKQKMMEELKRLKEGTSCTDPPKSDSALKLAALEEEKRKMMEELTRLKDRTSRTDPPKSDSASKLAALEEEKRKMMEELKRLKEGTPKSDSASKLAALEEEKRKMIEELKRLKEGTSKSDSASKLAALEEEKRKMMEELKRLKEGTSKSDSASKLAALEEEKRKVMEDLEKLKKASKSDSASKLAALEEEKRRLEAEVSALEPHPVPIVDDELKALEEELRTKERKLEESIGRSAIDAEKRKKAAEADLERLRKLAEVGSVEEAMKKRDEIKAKLDRKLRGVDICILMDCTGSMESWIREAADKALQIIDEVKKMNNQSIPRVAFIGYRDICDGDDRINLFDFAEAEKATSLRDHLSKVKAKGGGDTPEDIAGAFEKVFTLNWMSSTKLIIHIADAPCHGKKYHNCDDSYPAGDPGGLNPEDFLLQFASNKIDYYFARINSLTDKMVEIFDETYQRSCTGRKCTVLDVGDDASKFLPSIVESLSKSMSKS